MLVKLDKGTQVLGIHIKQIRMQFLKQVEEERLGRLKKEILENLIDASIREIAGQMALGRFYTRRV